MNGRFALGILAGILVAAGGCPCGTKVPPPPPPPPVHELCLEAGSRLNWYDDKPHTLFVRVFSLSTADAFAQADPGRLMDLQTPLPGAEGAVLDRTIYPDGKVTVRVTELPGVEYVGLVAGFYRIVGSGKVYVPIKSIDGGPCVRFGANGIEPLPVGPASPERPKK